MVKADEEEGENWGRTEIRLKKEVMNISNRDEQNLKRKIREIWKKVEEPRRKEVYGKGRTNKRGRARWTQGMIRKDEERVRKKKNQNLISCRE